MPQPDITLESANAIAVFRWSGDRYTHAVARGRHRLEAVESNAFDTPVFTEIHRQGEVLFASGMSGGRHWSASIESTEGGFSFDVACRVKSAERPAASCYQGRGLRLQAIADDREAPAISSDPESGRFHAIPDDPPQPPPYTLRYRYRVTAD